jgi:thioredoxin 1
MRSIWIICGFAVLLNSCGPSAPASKVQVVTEATFEKEVLESEQPVLVDFWAEWCGPCRLIAPAVDELSIKHAGKVKFVKLDIDEAPEASKRAEIGPIPALILFRDGKEVDRFEGVPAYNVKGRVAAWLEKTLAKKSESKDKDQPDKE